MSPFDGDYIRKTNLINGFPAYITESGFLLEWFGAASSGRWVISDTVGALGSIQEIRTAGAPILDYPVSGVTWQYINPTLKIIEFYDVINFYFLFFRSKYLEILGFMQEINVSNESSLNYWFMFFWWGTYILWRFTRNYKVADFITVNVFTKYVTFDRLTY